MREKQPFCICSYSHWFRTRYSALAWRMLSAYSLLEGVWKAAIFVYFGFAHTDSQQGTLNLHEKCYQLIASAGEESPPAEAISCNWTEAMHLSLHITSLSFVYMRLSKIDYLNKWNVIKFIICGKKTWSPHSHWYLFVDGQYHMHIFTSLSYIASVNHELLRLYLYM